MSSLEYESLVREQLNALGYNSAAIPDEVRAAPASRGPWHGTRFAR